jgi:dihydroflavonol-4-reductase
MNANRSALVLGGTGFIGGHIIKSLARHGWEIHALRRRPDSVGHVGGLEVCWHDGDLDDAGVLDGPLRHAEVLFHAAGYVPRNSHDVPDKVARSVQQTRNVCEAARRAGIDKMVYTSTLTTIGMPPQDADRLADERDSYLPGSVAASAYYECKYAMESEVLRYAAGGLPVVVVNPTFILGPEGVEDTIAALMKMIAAGWGRVSIGIDQNAVDVRDVAEGHVLAAINGRDAERYILGGTNIRVDALMRQIAELMEAPGPRWNLPVRWLKNAAQVMNFGSMGAASNHLFGIDRWQALSIEKAQKELGFRSRPLDVTLRETIEWYREQGTIPPGKYVV